MKRHGRAASALAAILAGLGIGLSTGAFAQIAVAPLEALPRLAAPLERSKGGSAVYIVKLAAEGAANYTGGSTGFAATKPRDGERFDSTSATVQSYVSHIESRHDALLASVGASGAKLHSFRYALNGFAAELTAAQASALAANPEVERIWLDTERRVATNSSAVFLGLEDPVGGLRADLDLRGEDIVVAVIDSGIAPNHPSLLDYEVLRPKTCDSNWWQTTILGFFFWNNTCENVDIAYTYGVPRGFNGICQSGDGFGPSDCNNKVVGARYYIDGFLVQNKLDPNEFLSPRDADGHGTHIATTIAGNPVSAYLFGTRVARIAGIAPRARIAVYKACWLEPGAFRATCATSDLARAIDDAVADGVDIINYSLGSLETDLTAPDDLALLNAVEAGVLTVVAAGNDGPSTDSVGSPSSAPWVLTVAASTQEAELFDEAIEIKSPANVAGTYSMREATFTPPLPREVDGPIEEQVVVADDGQTDLGGGGTGSVRDACEPLLNDADVDGRIVLIARGGCEFQIKLQHAQDAGAIAAIVYNNTGGPLEMNGDAGSVRIPAVMIGLADGQRLVDAVAAAGEDEELEVVAVLARGIFRSISENGNVMAEFSSRGPSKSDPNFMKPDVTAPGVNILGGHTPDVANGVKGETYQYLTGTSQAAPEVAGLAALLKEAHRDWSPAMIKSALMTTAYEGVIREDGELADPLDMGSGHVDPNRAIDPGLVYDADYRDYAAYLCGRHKPPFSSAECAALQAAGYSFAATDVNLPSIAVAELISGDTVRRRVTNLGPPATWTAEIDEPLSVSVTVNPEQLVIGTGETKEFTVSFVDHDAPLDIWNFGRLIWRDGERTVSTSLGVKSVALRAAEEIYLSGTSGTTTVPLAFGYNGNFAATVHGLAAPFTDPDTGAVPTGFVDDDPNNEFTFRFTNGVRAHAIDVPPDQLYMRVALFDEYTDGDDDLDLYLFYCPNDECTQVGQSGEFTSTERIDMTEPKPGRYVALVHGFQTDEVAGGPGANYSLFAWSVPLANADAGNLTFAAPTVAQEGQRLDVETQWSGLEEGTRYLGVILHSTPLDVGYDTTYVNISTD